MAQGAVQYLLLRPSQFTCLVISLQSTRTILESTMTIITGSWLQDILVLIVPLLYLLYWYNVSKTSNYFKERGIPSPKSSQLGGLMGIFSKSQQEMADLLYSSLPNEKFYGYFMFRAPTLLVKDPDLIQRIVVKDFSHFHDRGLLSSDHDPLSKNLFNLGGDSWRVMRHKLLPTFSTGKLKNMLNQIIKCGDSLLEEIDKISLSEITVEARLFVFNYPNEVIGCTAFGLDFSKNNPQAAEFFTKVSKCFELTFSHIVKLMTIMCVPKIASLFKITTLPRAVQDYFFNLTTNTKAYRKQNNVKRNDYFQLLLTLQESEESGKCFIAPATADTNEEDALINQMEHVLQSSKAGQELHIFTDEVITAQSFVFLTAGSETVTSTISFSLYHIGKNQQIQKRLKEEVAMVLQKHGDWTYQAIKDMTYLDQVIQETQRLYPAVALMMRECTVPYTIPNTNIVIEKGTVITIPISSIQRDSKYYPSPEVYDPDRFADNNFKPNPTYMPFGDGPRICIGMKFAILEVKVCLAKIFAGYSVEINNKTKEPITFDRKAFIPRPVGGIWVNFKKDSLKVS